jgi:hypothetical protein
MVHGGPTRTAPWSGPAAPANGRNAWPSPHCKTPDPVPASTQSRRSSPSLFQRFRKIAVIGSIFDEVAALLSERGLLMGEGTIVDATYPALNRCLVDTVEVILTTDVRDTECGDHSRER